MARHPATTPAVRALVKHAFETGRNNAWIEEHYDLKKRTVERMRHTWRELNEVYIAQKPSGGQPCRIRSDHAQRLLVHLEARPQATLDEMAWFLYDECGIVVSMPTISRHLKKLGWSRSDATSRAGQRDMVLRMDYIHRRMQKWKPDQMVFLDESVGNDDTKEQKYGWSPSGPPSSTALEQDSDKRWSVLPAYDLGGYIDWEITQGSFTIATFNAFVRDKLLPRCGVFARGEARSVIVLDNAQLHRDNQELQDMCDEAGVLLGWLPPYGPDFNPVDIALASLRSWLRKHQEDALKYAQDGSLGFGRFLEMALQNRVGQGDPRALYKRCHIIEDEVVTDLSRKEVESP